MTEALDVLDALSVGETMALLVAHAMQAPRAAGKSVSFDPNLRPSLWPDTAPPAQRVWACLAAVL